MLDPAGQSIAMTATDGTGSYVVDGVPAGHWTVEFVPDDGCLGADTADAFQYYSGAPTPGTATPVMVTAGQMTTGIDAVLATGAIISGTVTDPSGNALPGVCVLLEDTSGAPVVRQPTDTGGNYEIDQLPAGHFILQFVDDGCVGRAPGHSSTFLGGSTPATATVLDLGTGQIVGELDAMLDPLPSGSGSGGGESTTGPVTIKPVAPPGAPRNRRSGPRAVASLLRAAGGRWRVDARRRLHLGLRCSAGGPVCRVNVAVSRVRRRGTRLVAGARAGSRSATIRPGRTLALVVSLRGVHSGPLWIAVRGRDHRLMLQTVISVRWQRRRVVR